jgi:hypothetical protein
MWCGVGHHAITRVSKIGIASKTGPGRFCRFDQKLIKPVENRYKIQNLKFGFKNENDRFCQKSNDFFGLTNDFSENPWLSQKTKKKFKHTYKHDAINRDLLCTLNNEGCHLLCMLNNE